MGLHEVEKAVFVGPQGYRVIMARRSDVPRSWWYCNWLQQRYQPTGPFKKYEDAWALATNKLDLDAYDPEKWKLVAFRTPLGTWDRVLQKEAVPVKEVMRRITLKDKWETNMMRRIQRGGKW